MKNKLAWLVSRIFDPVVEIPVLLSATAWIALTNGLRWRFLVMLIVVDVGIPAAYMLNGLRTKVISDWDMTKRQERFKVFLLTVFCHLFGAVAALAVGKIYLFKILILFWLLAVVFAVITWLWKISVHAGVNAALVAFFNHYYGWDRYWWLVLILIVVLWSRVTIKKHNWWQVLAGAVVALVWMSLGLQWVVDS